MNDTTTAVENSLSNDAIIEIADMHKWFGDFHVLQDINLTVQKKERIVTITSTASA